MNYFQITAKCEEVNESCYTIQSTGEVVTKIQLSLVVPSMRDRVLCELPLEKAPKPELLDRWELERVLAGGLRRGHARPGLRAQQRPRRREAGRRDGDLPGGRRPARPRPTSASNCRKRARRRRSRPSSAAPAPGGEAGARRQPTDRPGPRKERSDASRASRMSCLASAGSRRRMLIHAGTTSHADRAPRARTSRWSIGSNTSCARAPPRWWCWRWSPIRWWPNCSTTRRGSSCSAIRCCSGYLLISAICSTVAFALFEVSTIFQLHDLMALDASIKSEIGAEKLIKRGYFVLAVSSLINFLSVLYFLALAWHTGSAGTPRPSRSTICPSPGTGSTTRVHASAYTAVLFLAGIFGERPKSGKEVILATQRALEQQALGALAAAEGSADRADDARWDPARRGRCGARQPGDGRAHRRPGSGHQRQPVSPGCGAAECAASRA